VYLSISVSEGPTSYVWTVNPPGELSNSLHGVINEVSTINLGVEHKQSYNNINIKNAMMR